MSDQPQIDRIPLWFRPYRQANFVDAGVSSDCHANLRLNEPPVTVNPFRIECQLRVFTGDGDKEFLPIRDAMIDTGAPFVLFPYLIWSQIEFPKRTIRWLRPREGDEYARGISQVSGTVGQSEPGRVGLIEISFGGFVSEGSTIPKGKLWTDRTVVFARFMEQSTKTNLQHVLIGLHALESQGSNHAKVRNRLIIDFNQNLGFAFLESSCGKAE